MTVTPITWIAIIYMMMTCGGLVGLLSVLLIRQSRQNKKLWAMIEAFKATDRHAFLPYIRAINVKRCMHWHPRGTIDWMPSQWSNAMAGEAGETCNAVKKLERVWEGLKWSNNMSAPEAVQQIAQEIGDTVLYADLLADRLGLQLSDCIRDTFNRVSIRENFPERL